VSNLKSLKKRIHSIESTKKITSAMKLVSSSYFKKAEKRLHAAVPYTTGLSRLVESVLSWKKVTEFTLIRGGKGSVHLLIVIGGTRGLCGGFNLNIGRRANLEIQKLIKEGKTVKIVCIGAKAFSSLDLSLRPLVLKDLRPTDKETWITISNLCEEINFWLQNEEIDTCSVIYASFASLLLSEVKSHTLVPYTGNIVNHNRSLSLNQAICKIPLLFEIEPSFGAVLRKSALSNLKSQVYFSILETQASEQSSRMIAMDGATKNSEEILRKLHLSYNRNRQAAITRELVEIISGAESI
jgi:F-type H+-transporting ATPase subunit gamma